MQLNSWDSDARFAFTHSLNSLHPSLRHDTHASRACKRRRPSPFFPFAQRSGRAHRTCTMRARKSSDASARRARELDAERERVLRDHLPERGVPPLGAPPSASAGFDGWWEGDDAYWQDLRLRELAFRAPTTAEPADYDVPSQPLDRHGRPVRYPAAARYDYEVGDWVPMTEEEEEVLRRPHPVVDPYFVAEAGEGEAHTTLRSRRTGEREPVVVGGLEFSEPLITDMSGHRRKRLDMAPGAWRVVHLGTSSAVPTKKRNVSSTAVVTTSRQVESGGEPSMFLVDVGENTDDQLIQCDWCMTHGFRWIRAIFITHLHGDHIYGLPMLLATIGKYAQHRRRRAVENGGDGSEPVIRIYGPYGTRGFVRASLYWDDPVGVRFSISELVPRDTDFLHLQGGSDHEGGGEIFVMECGSTEIKAGVGIDVSRESAPPHPEEVRVEDTHVSEDGLWHVWEEDDRGASWEVVAAPLRHRMPCFGYVFRERVGGVGDAIVSGMGEDSDTRKLDVHSSQNGTVSHGGRKPEGIEIDKVKAKALGVHGTQFRVLRSGRSVTVSKTGVVVSPDDVMLEATPKRITESGEERATKPEERTRAGDSGVQYGRKVTILGDTCDSSAIAEAAMDSELLIHEATFTDDLKSKAKLAMHSTARMAGEFGRRIRARKLALTHFSSRYEMFMMKYADDEQAADAASPGAGGADGGGREAEDKCADGDVRGGKTGQDEEDDYASPNQLVFEAYKGFRDKKARIIAAYDFLEHDVLPGPALQPGHSKNGIDAEYAGLAEGAQIVQASVE